MYVCMHAYMCHVCLLCIHQIVDFIVMDASIVSVDHKIKPNTVVAVLGHDMQQAM